VQGTGSNDGWDSVGFVVVVVEAVVDVLFLPVVVVVAFGTVVVVTAGGGGVCKDAFGGGFVGAMSVLPKIFTRSCWASGS